MRWIGMGLGVAVLVAGVGALAYCIKNDVFYRASIGVW